MTFDYKNPDYLPIYQARLRRLDFLRSDPEKLEAHKLHYKTNPVDFIKDWMITVDPRREQPEMPFIPWPKQAEYIIWLWQRYRNKEDGLVEKSRDAGATWLNMAFAIWLFLFHPGSKVSFGSRKEALVDKIGDPDSIFEKGRAILKGLPREFLPIGFNDRRDCSFLKFINVENGATITGEAGDNIGRGGRSGIYFKDESAFYERPELIDAALSQNSDVKIDVSTPNGNGNPFYKKRHSGAIPVFIFDWRDDPRKDDAWYQKQKDTLEPWILAQEVDRDYNASIEGICIPARYVQAAVNLTLPASGSHAAGLDVADEGPDLNCLITRRGPRVIDIQTKRRGDTTDTARWAALICDQFATVLVNYDSIGVGAGVKGELRSLKEVATAAGRRFPTVAGVNVGTTYLPKMFTEDRTDQDMFANLRASLWWRMRRRFERTYEHVNGVKAWEPDQMISIPNDQELISELSQPLREINEAGKIKIESKIKMKRRGIKSPNRADALMLAFANAEMIPEAQQAYGSSEVQRIQDYVTGKTKIHPDVLQKPGGNTYINLGGAQ